MKNGGPRTVGRCNVHECKTYPSKQLSAAQIHTQNSSMCETCDCKAECKQYFNF